MGGAATRPLLAVGGEADASLLLHEDDVKRRGRSQPRNKSQDQTGLPGWRETSGSLCLEATDPIQILHPRLQRCDPCERPPSLQTCWGGSVAVTSREVLSVQRAPLTSTPRSVVVLFLRPSSPLTNKSDSTSGLLTLPPASQSEPTDRQERRPGAP